MSKHVGRKERWNRRDAWTHTSELGTVEFRRGAWYARLIYRVREPAEEGLPTVIKHDRWLGPYKRPRNAMIALEREITMLQNRHGEDLQLGSES
jgi:hypothetical protein